MDIRFRTLGFAYVVQDRSQGARSMSADCRIVFLGTGGGRFVTITQRRRTAGIRIMKADLNLHLDPGPGALVHSIDGGFDPRKINAVFVSHCHPDHYTDAEILIEAMTNGMTRKRGTLCASKGVLKGSSVCDISISRYHQEMVEEKIEAGPGTKLKVGDINVSATKAQHTDPNAVGFRFTTESGDFAYTSDTEYSESVSENYLNVRLLILCAMRPSGKPWKGHMSTDDAILMINDTHPECAVLTHLGMSMLLAGPEKEAERIEDSTGVRTVAASDGMLVDFGAKIGISRGKVNAQRGQTRLL